MIRKIRMIIRKAGVRHVIILGIIGFLYWKLAAMTTFCIMAFIAEAFAITCYAIAVLIMGYWFTHPFEEQVKRGSFPEEENLSEQETKQFTFITPKENLYQTAIRNLRKKLNLLEQARLYIPEQIPSEEIKAEIKNNPDKYVINLDQKPTKDLIADIYEILSDLGLENLSAHDVSELFSIDPQELGKYKE